MAASIWSPSSSWSSISPSSSSPSSLRRNLKLTSQHYFCGQKHEVQLLNVLKGKLSHNLRMSTKSKQRFLIGQQVSFATSEGQPSCTELNFDTLESEKLPFVAEDDSSRSSLFLPAKKTEGKPGFVSFHGITYQRRDEIIQPSPSKEASKILWYIGPTVLVAFLVFPSLYLRQILSTVFEDSLLTDFLILFFTEALFYSGVAVFVFVVDRVWRPVRQMEPENDLKALYGLRISSVATLVLSLIIPLLTMGMVWPWTGPAASATLAPYLVGLVVQFAFEQYTRYQKSPAWSVIPVIFQVYRLHQLNRAAQLVTALSFSVRGAEATSQISAINNSLGALLMVLQILGVLCVWSLSSFLMKFLPSSLALPES